MKQPRGFSVLELVLAMASLAMLFLLLFTIFRVGSASYRLNLNRVGLQSEARRLQASLQKDLRETSYRSVSHRKRQITLNDPSLSVARDGLCFNALRSQNGVNLYEAQTGLPLWNSYLVYFATTDGAAGKLIRARVADPSPLNSLPEPLAAFSDAYLTYPGNSYVVQKDVKLLSTQVLSFSVELKDADQRVHTVVHLRQRSGAIGTGSRQGLENLELLFSTRPLNTWPKF
ncbi:MAG: hypothetical protein KF760_28020 [Candidatus Eremiobacteraeota bacterium]|nr:hypothetical protein [Candidatus Eremiobacteraeota bacterium]MCW5871491.1 hypothetical protein [Candidatus Eremiobacteraeota bacterium]